MKANQQGAGLDFRCFPRKLLLLALIPASIVAGCATPHASRYDYKVGWREGRVTYVGRPESINLAATFDCREKLSRENIVERRFARVIYPNSRHVLTMIVPVANDVQLKPGDKVFVKKNDCYEPLVTSFDARKGE